MSMDKWLSSDKITGEKGKTPKKYTQEEIQEGKKRKIEELIGNPSKTIKKNTINHPPIIEDDFLAYFMEFKNWLDQRTYLKGDIDKIETWIKNLYAKIESKNIQEEKIIEISERKKLIEDFKRVPPKLIEEKIRIALNKKLHRREKTNSDTYYLKKLKKIIQEKLREARYYEILKRILDYKDRKKA